LSLPRSSASSPQTLYPDFNSSSGCGYGLENGVPSFGAGYYFSSFTALFCGTANQTLILSNSTLRIYLASAGSQTPGVKVSLSDNGTIIAKSSATPSTTDLGCIPYTYNLSASRGGLMKSGDRLNMNLTFTGVAVETAICTGSGGPTIYAALTLYGAPVLSPQVTLSAKQCQSLLTLPYQKLAVGSLVTVSAAPSHAFTVPNIPNWNWYFVPVSNGQNPNVTADQIITQLWSSGHGQNFDFLIGTYNGQLGVVLMTDYSLVYECSG
jgi:hypothetical protein